MPLGLSSVVAAVMEIALGDDAKGANGREHAPFRPVDLVHAIRRRVDRIGPTLFALSPVVPGGELRSQSIVLPFRIVRVCLGLARDIPNGARRMTL